MNIFFKRLNYLSQPRRQAWLAAKLVIFLVLYGGLVAVLILYPVMETLDLLPADGLTPQTRALIVSLPPYFWPVIVALAGLAAVQVILQSHRVFGPSNRLQRAIRQMAAGQYGLAVRVRKGDYLEDFADCLAALDDSLCHRRQAFLEQIRALQARVQRHAGGEGSPAALPLGQAEIGEILQEISVLARLADGTGPAKTSSAADAGPHARTGAPAPAPSRPGESRPSPDGNPAASR